jgi:hypothetical protein
LDPDFAIVALLKGFGGERAKVASTVKLEVLLHPRSAQLTRADEVIGDRDLLSCFDISDNVR